MLCSSRVDLWVFLRRVELYAWVLACPPLCLGPDTCGDWASLFGLVYNGVYALFLCTFLALYVYFNKCLPTNGQTPKHVEIVSFKALFLNLVFVC